TGTLTTVVAAFATTRRLRGAGRGVAVLIALVAGAGLGAVVSFHAPRFVPLALLLPLASVIVAARLAIGYVVVTGDGQ
ncbi:MAG: hypothetical protein JWM85_1143, partial [Acidimicrobiaceae bacterium]|nr:hypothetical protein [Acidimicrobiaceae bacterium]